VGKYGTLGSAFDRIFRNTLNKALDDVDTDIQAQKKRVDDLIIGNPQPSEVVDSRGGFPVLGDRLNKLSSDMAQMMTYNLAKYCEDISQTTAFQTFMNGLDNTPKVLWIPRGKTLVLNKYFFIPSNTKFTGGGTISFEGAVTVNNLYNESLIANKNGGAGTNENIEFDNITINYNIINTGKSLMRFRGVDGLTVTNRCKFKMSGDGSINHNAILDIWKGNKNVTVEKSIFEVDNPSTAGGCIWIQNKIVPGNDSSSMESNNIHIRHNVFISNGGDEIVAAYSAGGDLTNVNVYQNTFIRKANSRKTVVLTALANTTNPVDISNINYYDNTIIVEVIAANNPEVIRVGAIGQTVALKDVNLRNNNVKGNLTNGIGLQIIGGVNEVIASQNTFTNTGTKGTEVAINSSSNKVTLFKNKINNFTTDFSVATGTIIEGNIVDGALKDNKSEWVNFQRNLASAGVQTITLTKGKIPKAIYSLGDTTDNYSWSHGFCDESKNQSNLYNFYNSSRVANHPSSLLMFSADTTTNRTHAQVTNLTAGNIELTWTLVGTGVSQTANIQLLVIY
jgi:hypothetical protein